MLHLSFPACHKRRSFCSASADALLLAPSLGPLQHASSPGTGLPHRTSSSALFHLSGLPQLLRSFLMYIVLPMWGYEHVVRLHPFSSPLQQPPRYARPGTTTSPTFSLTILQRRDASTTDTTPRLPTPLQRRHSNRRPLNLHNASSPTYSSTTTPL